ncbi:MAG: DUF4404 family protein [Planctomycetaceae bacterium]|nr:DUF4404 family protein [Planctomycetaceae bacterium]
MTRELIRDHLKQLHHLLQQQYQPDSETRQMLESLSADIQKVLSGEHDDSTLPPPATIREKVRVALLEFESQHPQISGLVERIADGLAGLGI